MNWKILTVTGRAYEKKYSVLPLSAKMLEASGLTEKQIEELLDTNTVLSTSQAECIQKACARIMRAKQNHEKVFVGGDYDVDGVCSTAIMKATLDALDIENGFYIPDRIKEGYGLSPKTVALAAKKGYTLIITVDNGVKAKEALQKAHELHMETIVTDHHVIEEQVECDILVHPTLLEAPFHYLSGAGIALEISRNLIGNRDDLNTMAGVASVTDVMPLWQETRKLVINALDALKQGKPHSLAALLPKGYSVDPSSIGFYIGPKLNSVGRMSDLAKVNTLPKYLLSKDDAEISRYAAQLENVNDQRKTRASTETKIAQKLVDQNGFLLIYQEDLHEGIVGQIAGNLADQYKKPCVVMAKNGNIIKGSGRSIPGFDLYQFFAGFGDFVTFGGHPMAVGVAIQEEKLPLLEEYIDHKIQETHVVYQEPEETAIHITADEVNFDNLSDLVRLDPLPLELSSLSFAVDHPEILEVRDTAKTVKYRIANAFGGFDAMLYKNKNIPIVEHPSRMIGKLELHRWNDKITCQMVIKDMQ